jgi:hypothetical protein
MPTMSAPGALKPINNRLAPLEGLGFDRSLDVYEFGQAVSTQVTSTAGKYLQSLPGTAAVTFDLLMKIKDTGLKVIFSPETTKMLQDGTAVLAKRGADTIAKARSVTTGQIIETGEVVAGSVSLASMAAATALIVVQLAHIISSADNSKRLAEANAKLDLLLQHREIDQISRLEGVYYDVQNLTSDISLSPHDTGYHDRARKLHRELNELRGAWRREIDVYLDGIKDPGKVGFWGSSSAVKQENAKRLRQAAARLQLIDYSLRLDRVLMLEIPDWKTVHQSLPFEIDEIQKTVIKLVEYSRFDAVGDTIKWKGLGRVLFDRLTSFSPALEPDAVQETQSVFLLTKDEYAFLVLGSAK